jgi:C-terminal processing protease CtpA/Prc
MRLLAATKLWTVVHFFFPYQHLMDRPWEPRLPELLDKLAAAKDARAYALALAEAGTWLQDGHVSVRGHPELQSLWGVGAAVVLTDIDGKAVVLEVLAPEAAPGLAVGDVIEKVDGEPIEARAQRLAPYVGGSTPAAIRDRTLQRTLSGAAGSTVTLGVRGAQGLKDVKLTRDMRFLQKQMAPSDKEPYRVLEGNIGFVDLGTLSAAQVPEMYEKLKDTRGIVFDLRNYPNFSMWALGPYLDVKGQRPFTWFEVPLTGSVAQARLKTLDSVPEQAVPRYRGRTVTLIDGRAISHAEHTGLMLEAAADTLFLGSPTAGANGNITTAVLPGGVQMIFTGLDVRHGDGRQLQRKGLEPHMMLRPTVAGLLGGRDELLVRAVLFLRDQPAPKAAGRAP